MMNWPRSAGGALETIQRLATGTIVPVEQDNNLATYAPKLSKDEGQIDFSRTAWEVHAQLRGVTPCPGPGLILPAKAAALFAYW